MFKVNHFDYVFQDCPWIFVYEQWSLDWKQPGYTDSGHTSLTLWYLNG